MRIAWRNTRNEPYFLRGHSYYQLKSLSIHEFTGKRRECILSDHSSTLLMKEKNTSCILVIKILLELLESDLNLECLIKRYKGYSKEAC